MCVCTCLEGSSGEVQQAVQDRLQHLEKELCFYKSSSRQLRKKLKERLHDSSHHLDQPLNTAGSGQAHAQTQEMKKETQTSTEGERRRTHVTVAFARSTAAERHDEITCGPSPAVTQTHPILSHHHSTAADKKSEVPECSQRHMQSRGDGAEIHPHLEKKDMTPVRLHRRELKQIFPGEQQVPARSRSMASSGEFLQEDSIEVSRKPYL